MILVHLLKIRLSQIKKMPGLLKVVNLVLQIILNPNDFKIYVVNSNGDKFKEKEWMLSETFNYKKQNKYIISDNQIRKYLNQSTFEKKISQYKTWGN
jgi:hypothetical protein